MCRKFLFSFHGLITHDGVYYSNKHPFVLTLYTFCNFIRSSDMGPWSITCLRMVKKYTLHENHGPSIINRSTFELWRRRIDHKSKILSNVRFEHYTYLHILLDIIFKGFFYITFKLFKVLILSPGHFAFLEFQIKFFYDAIRLWKFLTSPYPFYGGAKVDRIEITRKRAGRIL